ncbi:MAG: WXG100 family type VII secretion target [Bacilli bacterium]|nr:WXG100 family type VII secretion target [Bacilli bacterium]
MANGISANPELIKGYGDNVNQLGADYTTEINSIYSTIDELNNSWRGEAATQFNTTVKGYEQELKKLGTKIQDLGTDLGTIAGIYARLESDIADAASKL